MVGWLVRWLDGLMVVWMVGWLLASSVLSSVTIKIGFCSDNLIVDRPSHLRRSDDDE
jgi:hypothetical protein